MRYLYFLIFQLLALNTYSQNFSGYIVGKDHFVLNRINGQVNRYTPSIKDVEEAEAVLLRHIKNKKYEASDTLLLMLFYLKIFGNI